MSVYSTLHGTVRLDAAAASFFATTPSWQWCASDDDGEDRVDVSSSEDGSLMLDFASRCYRNLARYIHVDLALAQEHGAVVGMITDDCSDGGHSRTVTRFTNGRTAVTGSGDCFHRPVTATTGCVVELIAASDDGPGLSAFVSATLAKSLGVVQPSAVVGVELTGAAAVDACACAGWDDETDEPVCANT